MLLEFARPQAAEMDEAGAAELERHLAGCPECEEHARGERRIDQHLGQAMRQVEVPDRLRRVLLARLAQERGTWYRKRLRQVVSVAAGLAAVVLVAWGIVLWRASHLPAVNLHDALIEVCAQGVNPPLRDSIEEAFHKLGYSHVSVPDDLNFELLHSWCLGEFKGQQVPQLQFRRPGNEKELALVYLLSSSQFNLQSLDERQLPDESGYQFRVESRYQKGDRQATIIFYTGEIEQWLKPRDAKPPTVF